MAGVKGKSGIPRAFRSIPKEEQTPLICENCSSDFYPKTTRAKYCGKACQKSAGIKRWWARIMADPERSKAIKKYRKEYYAENSLQWKNKYNPECSEKRKQRRAEERRSDG